MRDSRPKRPPARPVVSVEERDLFMAAVADALPLGAHERDRVPPAKVTPIVRRAEPPTRVKLAITGDPSMFEMRAPGVSHNELAAARRGTAHIEETLDLHGDMVLAATAKLETFLFAAIAHGRRCVLIIHGRGKHSDGVSVVRNMVIEQLAGPLSGWVHAAITAAPRDGGDGATIVMLRSGR